MPYRKERKISEYHTRRSPKCKYCNDPVKHNVVNGRNKGYCKTCGKEECITASYKDPEVIKKKVFTGQRVCEKCSISYVAHSRNQRWCKGCVPDLRNRALMQRYGINQSEFSALVIRKDGKCPICEKNKASVVDHDHKTGIVRGVICNGCNMALHLVENEESLKRALNYLKNI